MQDGVILHAIDAVKDEVNNDNKRFSQNGDRLLGNDTKFDQGQAISSAAI
jgi:carbonic anhydrase